MCVNKSRTKIIMCFLFLLSEMHAATSTSRLFGAVDRRGVLHYINTRFLHFMDFLLDVVAPNVELKEGSPCQMENGTKGVCKKIVDCKTRLDEVLQGKRTDSGRCSFDGPVEIVCCNATAEKVQIDEKISIVDTDTRPAERACKKYTTELPVLPSETVFHIFEGIEVAPIEFPYVVALGYKSTSEEEASEGLKYICGGTLIAPQYVLTAAHCTSNINNQIPVEARLGSTNLTETKNVQNIPILEIIRHPSYNRNQHYFDIAIIKLQTSVTIDVRVKPICLNTKPVANMKQLENSALIVTGWGSTSFEEESSATLLKTPGMSLIDKNDCKKNYTGSTKLPNGLDDNMLCVLDPDRSRRSDACHGDSGGPLLLISNSTQYIVGITSFGQGCGTSIPGIYTSVFPYLSWIESVVWPTGSII